MGLVYAYIIEATCRWETCACFNHAHGSCRYRYVLAQVQTVSKQVRVGSRESRKRVQEIQQEGSMGSRVQLHPGFSRTNGSRYPPLGARPGFLMAFFQVASESFQNHNIQQTESKSPGKVQTHPESLGGVQAVQGRSRRSGGAGAVQGSLEALQPSCMSSLLRSCIQDCVQEVPVGQMAQGTPLGARRGLPRWLQRASSTSPWLSYQVSSEVFSKSFSVMSSLLLV